FQAWLAETPGFERIGDDHDAVFAIAQHHGLPTHYLDFTTDPAVAGFFAADTDNPEPGAESCIFCLNSNDLISLWGSIRKVRTELPELELVTPDVSSHWRLQAQAGTFLYAPLNWDMFYRMDRIVFPYRGYPAYPTRGDVYPDRKSQLEILLDQFFDNERKLEAEPRMRAMFEQIARSNPNAFWVEVEQPAEGYVTEYLRPGGIAPDPSWKDLTAWLRLADERHAEVMRRAVPLAIDLTLPGPELAARLANGVRRALQRDASLRRHAVTWRIEASSGSPHRPSLEKGLATLWDGLRSLPFDDAEIAQALGNWVALYGLGFDERRDPHAQATICDQVIGPAIEIAFGAPDGSSSVGYAARADLKAALRADLAAHLVDKAVARMDDLTFTLQVVSAPRLLFDFRKLAAIFATQVVPTQLIRSPPYFFHPARLSELGVP
ncbi:MAG: FRG domain-containing protein, partial [Alphaproteobacteria bacterium]|nr:FRG domain-containing protein [Alphaproteobacteria bacterium]